MRTRFTALVLLGTAASVASLTANAASAPPIASLRTLAAPAKLPQGYVGGLLLSMAAHIGITPKAAVKRTRLLLSNVTGLPLYAFSGNGQVCFVVWRGVGTCGVLDRSHDAVWAVNGGRRKRGQAVVGVVSDRVTSVKVMLDARTIPVHLRHNAFVAPFRLGTSHGPYPHLTVLPVTR